MPSSPSRIVFWWWGCYLGLGVSPLAMEGRPDWGLVLMLVIGVGDIRLLGVGTPRRVVRRRCETGLCKGNTKEM